MAMAPIGLLVFAAQLATGSTIGNTTAFSMPSLRTTSSECDARSLITQHEHKEACVYMDSLGNPTVGIGYNLNNANARQAISNVGADYDRVRAGTQCLSDDQIMKLFEPSYQGAVSDARKVVSSYDSLCCNVQEVMTDMAYNLGFGNFASFTQFVGFINAGQWQQAADDGRHTTWCGQVGTRCTDDMGRIQSGCSGPGPPPTPTPGPGPGPSPDNCCSCIGGSGGTACSGSCESHGSDCQSCVSNGGGKACGSRCGCSGPGPGPDPCPHPAPSPSGNQQWYGPSTCSKQTILFKGNVNKCVDLPNSDQSNGNKIQIWDCNSATNQIWNFDGMYIRSGINNEKCIDVPGGNYNNGNKLELWDCNGHTNQQWRAGPANSFQWESVAQPGKCIDLYGGNTNNGALLEIWDCTSAYGDGGQRTKQGAPALRGGGGAAAAAAGAAGAAPRAPSAAAAE